MQICFLQICFYYLFFKKTVILLATSGGLRNGQSVLMHRAPLIYRAKAPPSQVKFISPSRNARSSKSTVL